VAETGEARPRVALTSGEHRVSRTSLLQDLGISGTLDAQEGTDTDEDGDSDSTLESVVDGVFAELDDRAKSCGGENGIHPFSLTGSVFELKPDRERSIYVFLVLIALWSEENDLVFKLGVKLFEDLSTEAAKRYFGGPDTSVHSRVFAFPRRVLPAGFGAALDQLCREIADGVSSKADQPKSANQKDAKLDAVV